MALTRKISSALVSDVGRLRSNNEDAVDLDEAIGWFFLADGMGGYQSGEVASKLAAATTLEIVSKRLPEQSPVESSSAAGHRAETLLLKEALLAANTCIYEASQQKAEYAGMGTTAVTCLLLDDCLCLAWVGDSRAYRWREGQLKLLTRDHSLLEALIARGVYSREDAAKRVQKNIITRALGVAASVEVDVLETALQTGDILLLCSDGLNDMLEDRAIGAIICASAASLDQASQNLIDAANAKGGRDNVSVVMLRIDS
jgi:protein phosphatase